MSNKRILIIVESIDLEGSSGAKANVALIQNLHKAGFDLFVLHYTRKDIQLEGIKCIAIPEKRISLHFFLSRLDRHLRYIFKVKLNEPTEKMLGFSFTLFNDRNSIIAALKKYSGPEPDLILTLSQAGSFRPHHALLKMQKLHKKWMAYIHDPYPMHLYPRPFNWVEPGYHQKWKFMWDVSEKAAYSAFPSKLLQEWMGSYYPKFLKTGVIIPHQIINLPVHKVDFRTYFKPENFYLLHAGALLQPRNPQSLVLAFQRFLERNPETREQSKLIFVGSSSIYSSWLKIKENEIKELEIIDEKLPFPTVFKMQQNAAVNIILEAKAEISPFLPGKFPHCVQADKPVLLLGPNYSECHRLLGEDYPFWAEIDDTEKITGIIENLYFKWKKSEGGLKLDRPDLVSYLSCSYLEKTLEGILSFDSSGDHYPE